MIASVARKGSITPWRVAIATTLLGLLFGVLGPFGSYLNDGFGLRLLYWVGAVWAGLLFYGAALVAAERVLPSGSRGYWAFLVVSVLTASMPQTVLTRNVAILLWPQLVRVGPGWAAWFAQVALIGIVTVVGFVFLQRGLAGRRSARDSADGAAVPPIEGQWAGALRGNVIALQMEDHYVRVHTPTGSELVLMPLGRAIDAVAAIDGLRTHRSWWVARHAVLRVEGPPRSMVLRLSNGIAAPVARSAVASLRAAGWLEGG